MRVNEVEILGVPDDHLPAVQKTLKEKKGGRKKFTLKEVVDDVPPVFAIYQAVHIKERNASLSLSNSENMSLFQFFELYISSQHFDIIAQHTNINAEHKRNKHRENTSGLDSERETPPPSSAMEGNYRSRNRSFSWDPSHAKYLQTS